MNGLEQHLVLLAWLNRQFGYEHNRDLLGDMKEAAEGFDAEGRSFVYHLLVSRGDAVSISPDTLAQYDDNIRNHLHTINARRSEPITLRYFQYLAVLYAEVFLDGYFNRRGEMLRSLNEFVVERDANEPFSESDLKKLAFWMATGSGITLIMHLNYRQFSALQQSAPRQRATNYPQRGAERTASRRDDGLGYPLPEIRPRRERPDDGRKRRGPGH